MGEIGVALKECGRARLRSGDEQVARCMCKASVEQEAWRAEDRMLTGLCAVDPVYI